MGLFDKLNDVAKKATDVAGTYTQKAQNAITGTATSNSQETVTETTAMYIPQTQDLRGAVVADDSFIQGEVQEPWVSVKGVAKTFVIADKTFEVPENLDSFNTYRQIFRALAINCFERAETEYNAKVHDFVTFVEEFPQIYNKHLHPLIKRAVDVLVTENVWTVTYDSLLEQHKENFHSIIDDYEGVCNATQGVVEANQETTGAVLGIASEFIDGQLGGGMLGSILGSFKNEVVEGAVGSVGLTAEQQQTIYSNINSEILFDDIFTDYFSVFITLLAILNENGHDVWLPPDEKNYQQALNIFKNLSNPNFPQDKVLEAWLGILKICPYGVEFFRFAVSKFGETEEVAAIKNYFGYTDLDNPRII